MTRIIPLILAVITGLTPELTFAAYDVYPSRICISNMSKRTYYITGFNVNSQDWRDLHDDGAMNRPDHNWVNVTLAPSETRCQAADIDINNVRTAAFDFSVTDGSGLYAATLTHVYRKCKHHQTAICGDEEDNLAILEQKNTYWESNPTPYVGSLSHRHDCHDKKDPYYSVCDLFIIHN